MASPLNAELLSNFSLLFTMIFVFSVSYGVLQYAKMLGDNRGINGIVSLMIALMLIFVPDVVKVINILIPWMMIIFIFIFLMYFIFMFMGASENDLSNVLKKYKVVLYVVVTLSAIIFLGALGKVFFNSGDSGSVIDDARNGNATIQIGDVGGVPGESTFWATFFHPKVLGMIFLLLIGLFLLLTMATAPPELNN